MYWRVEEIRNPTFQLLTALLTICKYFNLLMNIIRTAGRENSRKFAFTSPFLGNKLVLSVANYRQFFSSCRQIPPRESSSLLVWKTPWWPSPSAKCLLPRQRGLGLGFGFLVLLARLQIALWSLTRMLTFACVQHMEFTEVVVVKS